MRVMRPRSRALRSTFEDKISEQLTEAGVDFEYEPEVLCYEQPSVTRKYTPDFVIRTRTGKTLHIETKGHFTTADRKKMKLVKASHPELDIRMVFGRAQNKISKRSKTTYAMWSDRYGFPWADGEVPEEWLDE